ncbi:MAG: hypothetical protein FWC76_06030 [Defluviitaleaceae bacterium]|nr:hypothetical protein [Defluviitaleaceae bacterium]
MKKISCLIIAAVFLLAFASCDQTAEEPTIEAEPDIAIEEIEEVAEIEEHICYKPDGPIVLMDVTFAHPTLATINYTAAFTQGHVEFYRDLLLEMYVDGVWYTLSDIMFASRAAFIYPQATLEGWTTHWGERYGVLGMGQYRIWRTFWHHCICGEITSHDVYAAFAITHDFDEFDLILQDPRQYSFIGEVVDIYAGRFLPTDEDNIAILVRSISFDWGNGYNDPSFIDRIHGVWLNEHIIARDADDSPINPADIPIGSIVNVRGFPHTIREGHYYEEIEYHVRSTRLIEIIDEFEMHLRDPRQHTFGGGVVGFYTGRYDGWPEGQYGKAIMVGLMFREGFEPADPWLFGRSDPSDPWLFGQLHAVWINEDVVARDSHGTPINPADIALGTVINVRGFSHPTREGYFYDFRHMLNETSGFHTLSTRLIEVVNQREAHLHDPRQRTITGEVVGFHFGHFDGWLDEDYDNAIIIDALHGIWLNEHVLTYGIDGTPINPLDIPMGAVINVRGFGHSDTCRGANQDYFQLSVFHTRLIDVIDY